MKEAPYTQNHDGLNYYIDPDRGDIPPHIAYRIQNEEQRQREEDAL